MAIKLSPCGRIWLTDDSGACHHELTLTEASEHLQEMQNALDQEAADLSLEHGFTVRLQHLENLFAVQDVEKRLRELEEARKAFRTRETEIPKQQSLDREDTQTKMLEVERLREEHSEILEVLRLEKACLDRDRTEFTSTSHQQKEQNKQIRLALDIRVADIRRQEEDLRQQQQTLECEKLNFELLMNKQGEEARKVNKEILERDREVQQIEAREREVGRIEEARDAERRRREVWEGVMEKLRVREEMLEGREARVVDGAGKMNTLEQELKDVKKSLTEMTEESEIFRMNARARIERLVAKHKAKETVMQVELKRALEEAQTKERELQDLRAQLVEDDPKTFQEQKSASKKFVPKKTNSTDPIFTHSPTVKKSENTPAEESKQIPQTTRTKSSPTDDNFIFIGPESTTATRDRALTRDSDSEDYFADSDSDPTD